MKLHFLTTVLLATWSISNLQAKLTLQEVRTVSSDVLVAFFTSDTLDIHESDIADSSAWTINGKPAKTISRYVTQADPCDHTIYLQTDQLKEGKKYELSTPFGDMKFKFKAREIFCESIKTNQVGYSVLSKTRYANFAIWLGTGGSRKIEGELPKFEVFNLNSGKVIAKGVLSEMGEDESSGDYVYRIDLSTVPEGGPYKIVVKGIGCSYPLGVGGEFSRRTAYITFRAQYLQRCGCPILEPDIRKKACHTLIYDVDGPIGEANIVVEGTERTFKCYGGYHDAGDADRRAYHIVNPIIDLMIYEAFPEYFYDGQFDIPGEFDEDYNILSYTNDIPDLVDEAEWGALVWEYLQNEDGSVHFGTETKKYPDPFAAPLDQDDKKYGTVLVDPRATCTSAGMFMHLARILKPYKPEKANTLMERAERAMAFGDTTMADAERLYYHLQRYLLTGDEADHEQVKALYTIVNTMKDRLYETPGYSLNDEHFDNPAYIYGYLVEKEVPTDPTIVEYFKTEIKAAADSNIAELRKHAYPVGNNSGKGGWGHNVRQPQYACAPMLYWSLTHEQKYIDAASELMDFKLGLNPIGISYVTGLGFHQVHNPHDRESAYTINLGWGPKPGITVFGPGVARWVRNAKVLPPIKELANERQFIDDMRIISFTEFTIFETLTHDAFYSVLSKGKKWNHNDPYTKQTE
ncbi:glycoside hydrolase family 9 protein [candidate division KSB1 bacterium]|nr:glycoside hydrolase family 9 protein [candidate division KSB1 bacterium]